MSDSQLRLKSGVGPSKMKILKICVCVCVFAYVCVFKLAGTWGDAETNQQFILQGWFIPVSHGGRVLWVWEGIFHTQQCW